MSSLPPSTINRLKRIPQLPNVWEGDSFPIGEMMDNIDPELQQNGRCILWVDGSEGFVRSMDVINQKTGHEAMVRALLKAIENPHSPAEAARPLKVVVKNRELQFFLRGALQDLDINVDYQPELPLLDEIWRNFQVLDKKSVGNIPSDWLKILEESAIALIWQQDPWASLAEYNVIELKINAYNIESLYISVMGMMGKEFGVIFYRSLDSLKKFRSLALEIDENAGETEIERAFLQQDCWFLNFSGSEEFENTPWLNLFENEKQEEKIEALFGSIHPYEGVRPIVEQEEIYPIYIAIQALGEFINQFESELEEEPIPLLQANYEIKIPWLDTPPIPITINSMPEVSAELEEMMDDDELGIFFDDDDDDDDDDDVIISDDLIPRGSFVNFAIVSRNFINNLKTKSSIYLDLNVIEDIEDDEIPVMVIQTTRPKAKTIIEQLDEEGGVEYLFFSKGIDSFEGIIYRIAVIQTMEDINYIITEFQESKSSMGKNLQKWIDKVSSLDNFCGILVAMGATGASRGNPSFKDTLGFFGTTLISSEELGLEELIR